MRNPAARSDCGRRIGKRGFDSLTGFREWVQVSLRDITCSENVTYSSRFPALSDRQIRVSPLQPMA